MKYQITTVGNVVIDALLTIDSALDHCRLHPDTQELCVNYGSKVLVENNSFALGGGSCRVAMGLSRLGFSATIYAEIGNDEFAQKIRKTLKEENVDTSHLVETEGQCSFTVGLNFGGERTLFTHYVPGVHDFRFDSLETDWIYLGSLGNEWQLAYTRVAEYIKSHQTKLAFNPGSSQFAAGRESFMPLVQETTLLVVNKQEAQTIAETKEDDVVSLLRRLQSIGPKIVVITDGKNGSFAINEEGEMFSMPMYVTKVVEKTGAGDAYGTGFLAAIASGKNVEEAMSWGTVNAASVVSNVGERGLLRKDEMVEWLKKADLTAEKIQ